MKNTIEQFPTMKNPLLFLLICFSPLQAKVPESDVFIDFNELEIGVFKAEKFLAKNSYPLQFNISGKCLQPQGKVMLNQSLSLSDCGSEPSVFRTFRKGTYYATIDNRSGLPTLKISIKPKSKPKYEVTSCPKWNRLPLSVDVSSVFSEGENVRDFYSGEIATVINGKVTFTPNDSSDGLMLLEKAPSEVVSDVSKNTPFDWYNATIYFVMTDRFYNGDHSNDHSYGRRNDNEEEIGTFHGGDLRGLTEKLDYLSELGVNALWISSPLEQVHGWIGGGSSGDFPHYAYHGYYHQDWTKLDKNMGTEDDLKELITQAHQRGIRVIFDVVMNHTGYATLADMQEYGFGKLSLSPEQAKVTFGEKWTNWTPKGRQSWHSIHKYIDYSDKESWRKWWGKPWVRAGLGDYDTPKSDDLRMTLSGLPDIKTAVTDTVQLPEFLTKKTDSKAKNISDSTVRQYFISWLSDWVREYGVDGFRVDTAKHVEKDAWLALKNASSKALIQWQEAHPEESQKLGNQPFWMTGEVWGHTVRRSDYYDNGFDAMINFEFQDKAKEAISCYAFFEKTYVKMNEKLQKFNSLSYLSSHDTRLFFHSDSERNIAAQKTAANMLLLSSGAVQLFYGDESGRSFGPTGSDPQQGTRSDMNWGEINNADVTQNLLGHWQKVAKFRQKHLSIGKGVHKTIETKKYYAFSRHYQGDKVMVVWGGE